MKKKKINNNENEWKGILQETQSNISTESVTSTNVRSYEEKAKALQEHLKTNPDKLFYWETPGSDYDVDYCNVKVNKDWDNEMFFESLKKLSEEINYKLPIKKDKTIEFEYNLKFWQLFPSIAINLVCNEIEITWLCFNIYIKYN